MRTGRRPAASIPSKAGAWKDKCLRVLRRRMMSLVKGEGGREDEVEEEEEGREEEAPD
jgi:hypothetical protein